MRPASISRLPPAQDVELGSKAAADARKTLPVMHDDNVGSFVEDIGRRLVGAIPQELEQPEFESVVVPMSLRVTIVELKESMCRWPLGDPATSEFRYCVSPTASGPYCAYHGGLAYQPVQERRRDRDRDRLRRPLLR